MKLFLVCGLLIVVFNLDVSGENCAGLGVAASTCSNTRCK